MPFSYLAVEKIIISNYHTYWQIVLMTGILFEGTTL